MVHVACRPDRHTRKAISCWTIFTFSLDTIWRWSREENRVEQIERDPVQVHKSVMSAMLSGTEPHYGHTSNACKANIWYFNVLVIHSHNALQRLHITPSYNALQRLTYMYTYSVRTQVDIHVEGTQHSKYLYCAFTSLGLGTFTLNAQRSRQFKKDSHQPWEHSPYQFFGLGQWTQIRTRLDKQKHELKMEWLVSKKEHRSFSPIIYALITQDWVD